MKDAEDLKYRDWKEIILSKEYKSIFPHNCFPTDEIKDKYLNEIDNEDERNVRTLLRRFLMRTGNFETDNIYAGYIINSNSKEELQELLKTNEYPRRLLSSEPTWEGLTWVLDLLPAFPNDALKAVNSYFQANCLALPDFSLQGLSDSSLIIAAKYVDYEHPQDIFLDLTPGEFEKLVEKLYRAKGYQTELTQQTRDGGVDIIAIKENQNGKEKLIIQCKRYTKKITVKEVRELNGVLQDYPIKHQEKMTKAVLVCSTEFTKAVKKEFKNNHTIELIDYKNLSKELNLHQGRYWASRLPNI